MRRTQDLRTASSARRYDGSDPEPVLSFPWAGRETDRAQLRLRRYVLREWAVFRGDGVFRASRVIFDLVADTLDAVSGRHRALQQGWCWFFLVLHSSDVASTAAWTVIYRGQIWGGRLARVDKGGVDSLRCLVSLLQTMKGSAAC